MVHRFAAHDARAVAAAGMAATDLEPGPAAAGHPDAAAVIAPGLPEHAGRLRIALHQAYAAAGIGRAITVAVVDRGTADDVAAGRRRMTMSGGNDAGQDQQGQQ